MKYYSSIQKMSSNSNSAVTPVAKNAAIPAHLILFI